MSGQPKQFKLGHLKSLNQVVTALGKTIRAMADGTLDDQKGARICNSLGILRTCLETRDLDILRAELDMVRNMPGAEHLSRIERVIVRPGEALQ